MQQLKITRLMKLDNLKENLEKNPQTSEKFLDVPLSHFHVDVVNVWSLTFYTILVA